MTKPGSTSAVPVNGIDWYPTLLDLAGIKVPKKYSKLSVPSVVAPKASSEEE